MQHAQLLHPFAPLSTFHQYNQSRTQRHCEYFIYHLNARNGQHGLALWVTTPPMTPAMFTKRTLLASKQSEQSPGKLSEPADISSTASARMLRSDHVMCRVCQMRIGKLKLAIIIAQQLQSARQAQ